MLKNKIICFLLFVYITIWFGISAYAATENQLKFNNPGFEQEDFGWSTYVWDKNPGVTEISYDSSIARSGGKSVCISNHKANDARLMQKIAVEENSFYRITGWTKTVNAGDQGKGANLSVEGLMGTSEDITGTNAQWKQLFLYGRTGEDQTEVTITVGLGGYGMVNTGKVWFDDIEVAKLDTVPEGVTAISLQKGGNGEIIKNTRENNADKNIRLDIRAMDIVVSCSIVLAVTIIALVAMRRAKLDHKYFWLVVILALSMLVRIISAICSKGHPIDMGCFRGWAAAAADHFTGFYTSGTFSDYPPLYIYVLFVIGKLMNWFQLASDVQLANMIIKLPSMLADLGTAFLLFKLADKGIGKKAGLAVAVLYVFNPAVILNSAIWGQVDSLFTLFIAVALVLLVKNEMVKASAVFSFAVLLKPQGIIFLPVLFFVLLKTKKPVHFVKAAAVAFAVLLIVILPFSFHQEPFWIFKLYMKTISEYPYATLNAFNLFALVGANWKNVADGVSILGVNLMVSYKHLGLGFIVITTLYAGFLQLKGKNIWNAVLSALVLITGVFVLASGMHERYMFPAMAISLVAYAGLKDIRLLLFYLAASFTGFVNTLVLYKLSVKEVYFVPANDMVLMIISVINIAILVYLVMISIDIALRDRIREAEYLKE